jgi:hypothetical protein
MPTARFEADFSSFIAAINAAQFSMADMGKGADQVQQHLNDMADKFSGRELIQEASLMTIAIEKIGGTAALTGDELEEVGNKTNEAVEKLKAMGSDVPAGLQKLADATKENTSATSEWSSALGGLDTVLGALGIGTSIASFGAFVKALASGASEITNLSERLQTTTSEVQKFQAIAGATGVPIDTITNAMQRLSEKIGEGDAGTIGALAKLHISVDDFKNNTMYQDFTQIAAGIDKMGDAESKNAEARALFGNSFKQLTPALKADIDTIGTSTVQMSGSTVLALDQASVTWNKWYTDFKNISANMIAEYVGLDTAMLDYIATIKAIPDPPKFPQAAPLKASADSISQIAAATADMNAQLAATKKANDDWLATLGRIDDASANLIDTLRDMDDQTVKDGEALLKLGVSAADVAERLGITDVQVKALQNDLASTKTYQTAIDNIITATTDWAASLSSLAPIVRQEATAELAAGAAVADVATKYGIAAGQVNALKAQIQDGTKYTNEWQKATDAINNSYIDWKAAAEALSPVLKDTILYQVSLGNSAKDVATANGLQIETVKGLIQANKDLVDQQQKNQKQNDEDYEKIIQSGSDIRQNAFYEADAIRKTALERGTDLDLANKAAEQIIADADAKAKAEEDAAARTIAALNKTSNARNAGGTFKAGDADEQAAMKAALAEVNASSLGQMIAQGTTNVDLMNQYQMAIEQAMANRGYSIGGGLTPAAMAAGASAGTGTNVNTTVNVQGSTLGTSQSIAAAVSQAMTQTLKSLGYSLPAA